MVERLMDDSAADAREHFAEPADIEQASRGVASRRAQQHVVGLMAAQYVVNEIGRDGDLTARLLLARKTALDQPGNDRAIAEGPFHQRRFGEPGFEIVAEHVLIEKLVERQRAAL